ncbi:MAG TPA: hypothetical protein VEL76_13025 [Gemmataceae bacterium]|nr:hypothetical protein [Gemmataceae bacterium]
MANDLKADIERILATLTRFFADEGTAREVALLALSRHRIEQTSDDNWDGGQYGYTVYLEVRGTSTLRSARSGQRSRRF